MIYDKDQLKERSDEFWDGFEKSTDPEYPDCIVWAGTRTKRGYGKISWQSQQTYTHRLAWALAHHQEIPEGLQILHTCDHEPCGNPEHLYIGTVADNMRDRDMRDRNGICLFTNAEVRMLRCVIAGSERTIAFIARKWGVAPITVQQANRGLTYAWVQ